MNNRIIKFRVWNKELNKLFYTPNSAFLFNDTSWAFHGSENPQDITGGWKVFGTNANAVIQQFTGFKDKNGADIYEGDIIVVPDEDTEAVLDDGSGPTYPCNHVCRVVWGNEFAAFGVNIEETANYFNKGFHSFVEIKGEMGDEFFSKECEVIGNIFQNPELL